LWVENSPRSASLITRRATIERKPDHDDTKRTKAALAIWHSAKPSHGTPVETYLASRAICVPTPDALRFHPGLRHPSGGIWSVMAALVTSGTDGTPIAIHRTFLARDGAGKAPVDPPKMMFGPCRGGAVRLADPSDVLMVGEGIETCLAAMLATGYPAWAALSTSGLRGLDLPKDVRDLIVLADGDEAGDAAAEDCALRWKRQGRRVRIARPPRGMDFNEMLTGRAPFLEERPQ
jgi:putative DNA primase/helicase